MEYQWDQAKAAANLKKHGVAFPDAALASKIRTPSPLLILMQSTNQGSFALAPIPAVVS
jgi:uncharacterized DUF497 family protein